jgi:hypothetical protein
LFALIELSILAEREPGVDAIGAADNSRHARVIGPLAQFQTAWIFIIDNHNGALGNIGGHLERFGEIGAAANGEHIAKESAIGLQHHDIPAAFIKKPECIIRSRPGPNGNIPEGAGAGFHAQAGETGIRGIVQFQLRLAER